MQIKTLLDLQKIVEDTGLVAVNIHRTGNQWSCWTRSGPGWSRAGQFPTLAEAVQASIAGETQPGEIDDWESLL